MGDGGLSLPVLLFTGFDAFEGGLADLDGPVEPGDLGGTSLMAV